MTIEKQNFSGISCFNRSICSIIDIVNAIAQLKQVMVMNNMKKADTELSSLVETLYLLRSLANLEIFVVGF